MRLGYITGIIIKIEGGKKKYFMLGSKCGPNPNLYIYNVGMYLCIYIYLLPPTGFHVVFFFSSFTPLMHTAGVARRPINSIFSVSYNMMILCETIARIKLFFRRTYIVLYVRKYYVIIILNDSRWSQVIYVVNPVRSYVSLRGSVSVWCYYYIYPPSFFTTLAKYIILTFLLKSSSNFFLS